MPGPAAQPAVLAPADEIKNCIQEVLTPDLLKKAEQWTEEWRQRGWLDGWRYYEGYCYCASEAYYWLNGGKDSGLTPRFYRDDDADEGERGTHRWLVDDQGRIIDMVLAPDEPIDDFPYADNTCTKNLGFLPVKDKTGKSAPSARAREIMRRVRLVAEGKDWRPTMFDWKN